MLSLVLAGSMAWAVMGSSAIASRTSVAKTLIINHVYSEDTGYLFTQIGAIDSEGRWRWWKIVKYPSLHLDCVHKTLIFTHDDSVWRVRFQALMTFHTYGDLEVIDREMLPVDRRKGM